MKEFPEDVQDVIGYALYLAQIGGKHPDAKPLSGGGAFRGTSVLEVVANDDGNTYRAVYTVRVRDVVYVLHCFQKKSTRGIRTQPRDIEMIKRRLKAADDDYASRRAGNR